MITDMRAALRRTLPAATDAEIDAATQAALGVLGFFEPQREMRVKATQGCNLRAKPDGPVVGTVMPNVFLLAGQAEGKWTPALLCCWIGSGMVALA